jgi:hypothetical protein
MHGTTNIKSVIALPLRTHARALLILYPDNVGTAFIWNVGTILEDCGNAFQKTVTLQGSIWGCLKSSVMWCCVTRPLDCSIQQNIVPTYLQGSSSPQKWPLKMQLLNSFKPSEATLPVSQHRTPEDLSAHKYHRQNHRFLKYQYFNHGNNLINNITEFIINSTLNIYS